MTVGAKNTNVVMLTATYDAAEGEVVKVDAETAARLVENGHAREPFPGEVKKASEA